MSVFSVSGVKLEGIVTAVPNKVIDNLSDKYISMDQGEKVLKTTGIRYRHIAKNLTASDLCFEAATNILNKFKTAKTDIEVVIFVSQTPDFILPATAPILQHKLGLETNIAAFDINMGCSGYVYGLSTISSILSSSKNPNARALLLVGDTISKLCSFDDSATYPLFGDAGSATLLSKTKNGELIFDLNSNGAGSNAIKVESGGFRNTSNNSRPSLFLNGMDVFSFGISVVPKSIKDFLNNLNKNIDQFDYFIFHQANKFMNEKIRKKLKIEEHKVPYSLMNYANTSCATIPLTITTELNSVTKAGLDLFICGFGVGLSWASAILHIEENFYLNNIIVDE